jgi:hypothetical protein
MRYLAAAAARHQAAHPLEGKPPAPVDEQAATVGQTGTISPQAQESPGLDTQLELGNTGWRATLTRRGKEFAAYRCTMTAGQPGP